MQRLPPLLHGQAEAGRHRRPGRALRAPLRTAGQEVLIDADRLGRLRQAKLRGAVADRWGPAERVAGVAPSGASLQEGARGWVLVEEGERRSLGAALGWAQRQGVGELHVVVDAAADPAAPGYLAWRAAAFAAPPTLWALHDRELTRAEPEPPPPAPALDEGALAWLPLLEDEGTEPVVEHGLLRAEVLGLEVARVVPDPAGGWRLEVGVGAHDRAALAELRPGEDPRGALTRVVAAVRRFRRPGVPAHPANLLARERWLRAVLVARPELVGTGPLAPVPPALPRTDLRLPAPAPAAGDGVVVVASTGVDVDLVPAAAAVRSAHEPAARLVLAVPDGDDHPLTRRLAAALADPATVVTVPREWAGADPR